MSESFELHPDLARDGIQITNLRLSHLLLMNDAAWPWLVLVPQRPNKKDFHDLDPMDQYRVCDEITLCSQALSRLFNPDKVNVAALGNMTPQLHIHVIARFSDDPAWPGPIWGKQAMQPYPAHQLEERLQVLRQELTNPL